MSEIVYRIKCLGCGEIFDIPHFSILKGRLVVGKGEGCPFCGNKKMKGLGLKERRSRAKPE